MKKLILIFLFWLLFPITIASLVIAWLYARRSYSDVYFSDLFSAFKHFYLGFPAERHVDVIYIKGKFQQVKRDKNGRFKKQ
jgi:hypothetical protein